MIRYTDSVANITAQQLEGFFVGWPNPPSPHMHQRLLSCSDEIVLAVDDEAGKVVGFITALTDGVLCAYIPLLEVLPEYQGKGIGHELVKRMMDKLDGLYMIDAVCDKELQPFYQELGMQPAHAMIFRRHGCQSGRQ